MAEAAIERCRNGGFKVSVTIVDSGGIIRVHVRDDGTALHEDQAQVVQPNKAKSRGNTPAP